ncbi:MAG: hypothetical protein Q9220_004884 [cf. Caloplaca sp. 1 TL-2023]
MFLIDDPPFYLQKPSSDEGSIQAVQAEQLSSRPGNTSQLVPLSHSLLSQLELSENDPNTFREIIDDLTVQNQRLKRRIRRYKKVTTAKSENMGIFEVRAHNLPSTKKQELQLILQNFASTLWSSVADPASPPMVSRRRSGPREANMNDEPLGAGPVVRKSEDSTYASKSVAGGNLHVMSGDTELSNSKLHRQQQSRQDPDLRISSESPRLPPPPLEDTCDVSDKSKQLVVVQKLEELFLTRTAEGKPSESEELPRDSLSSSKPIGSTTSNGAEYSESQPYKPTIKIISSHGGQHQAPDSQMPNGDESKYTLCPPKEYSSQQSEAMTSQNTLAPCSMRCLREMSLASAMADTSNESMHEWMYLNVLVNMAQLHTLNVTADFVRQAIRDVSTRIILSEDGRKVRWCGGYNDKNASSSGAHSLALSTGSAAPKCASPIGYSYRPQQSTNGSPPESTSSRNIEPLFLPQQIIRPAIRSRDTKLYNSSYKPYFLRNKRRGMKSNLRTDVSTAKSKLSSDDEESFVLSHAFKNGPNLQDQPMIFFDYDPFFVDLSADPPDVDRLDLASYNVLACEPLGIQTKAFDQLDSYEPKSMLLEQASHDFNTPTNRSRRNSTEGPLLRFYVGNNDIPPSCDPSDKEGEVIPFEASGLGGIQLDDHFTLNVAIRYKPSIKSISTELRAHQSRKVYHANLSRSLPSASAIGSNTYSHHVIACTTTYLPPSPFPPPSYVYPPLSSSSSLSSTISIIEDDMGYESEVSTPRFRPMSLSPQMRMFLEQQG